MMMMVRALLLWLPLAASVAALAAVDGAAATSGDAWETLAADVLASSSGVIRKAAEDGAQLDVPAMGRALLRKLQRFAEEAAAAAEAGEEGVDPARATEYPYFDILPQYMGSVQPYSPDMPAPVWEGRCFAMNAATVSSAVSEEDGSVTLTFTTRDSKEAAEGVPCRERYWLMSANGFQTVVLSHVGDTTMQWTPYTDSSDAETYDYQTKGVRIFRALHDDATLLANLVETLKMFTPLSTQGVPPNAAAVNADFMTRYAGFPMEPRDESFSDVPDESEIHSGDFFGIIRLDGLDPLVAWFMGSTTGHTTVALWDEGELYVAESTVLDSYWPTDGVQRTPYRQWIKQAHAAGYNVVHVPLSEEARAKFSEESANEYFKSVEGFEYGYANMFWGLYDVKAKNLPCLPPDFESNCLDWEFAETGFALLDRVAPELVDLFVNQAWNKRLGTSGLRTAELYQEAESHGLETRDIPTLVEQDDWVYNTTRYGEPEEGPAIICCVLVCGVWKAAGVFDDIDSDFNCAELTDYDAYVLTILDPAGPTQILGDYTLTLNDFNTRAPYKHMAESCPSFPDTYYRPDDC